MAFPPSTFPPLDRWEEEYGVGYEEGPEDHIFISSHLDFTARNIFKTYAGLKRLRDESGLRTSCTPAWATLSDFQSGIFATWGTAAEALALTLYHLAGNEGLSGDDVDKYRDVAEFTWSQYRDSKKRWYKDGESYEGNPATARIVFRAVNLAYDIAEGRSATSGFAGSLTQSQAAYREHRARARQPPPYMDLE